MKYLLVIAVVLIAVWLWRNNRREEQQEKHAQQKGKGAPLAAPQDMVRCPVCSVHLPRTDALAGPDGRLYCCQEHRQRAAS
jgi:uncharacterized protein